MQTLPRAVMLLGLLIGPAACAAHQEPGADPASTVTSATIAGPPPSPLPSEGSAPSQDKIKVTVGKPTYQVGAEIVVTVANGSNRPVYTEDFKTACSIVTLQRSSGDGWLDVTGCAMGRPTMMVMIGPGFVQVVTIDPHSFHLQGQAIPADRYRIKLDYRFDSEPTGQEPLLALSPAFAIKPQ